MSAYVGVSGRQIVDPTGNPLFLKSLGLGMWLVPEGYMFRLEGRYQSPTAIEDLTKELIGPEAARQFWLDFREHFVTEADIAACKAVGFNSIRLPFTYKLISPEWSPGVYLESGWQYLDRLIEWCEKHELWVILDMHCAPGGQTGTNIDDSWGHPWLWESESDRKRTVDIWRTIARRYARNATVLGYDLLNEPIPNDHAHYNHLLEPLYREITQAIREVDAEHLIFLEGAHWATDFTMFDALFDDKIVFSFHKYWNENNKASIQHYLDVRDKFGVPLWNGETGENNNEWYRACLQLMAEHDIGWSFWTWKKLDNHNCPFTIKKPLHWDEIIEFTRSGKRPSVAHAQAAFDELLDNVRLEQCIKNDRVIDAIFLR